MTKQTIHQFLKDLIKDYNISELSRKTGISRARLYHYLKGDCNITFKNLIKLIDACGYDMEFNIKRRGE